MLHKSSVRTQWNGLRTSLVRNPFISPEIIDPKFVINMPVDAIASSRSIYATTLYKLQSASRQARPCLRHKALPISAVVRARTKLCGIALATFSCCNRHGSCLIIAGGSRLSPTARCQPTSYLTNR
ncbi:MAG: hypothetical protein VB140_06220 [Burkholderia sp.]